MDELLCIKSIVYHWGTIFECGKYYKIVRIFEKDTRVITNNDKYWECTRVTSRTLKYFQQGYTEDNIHEVMPGYIKISERDRLYTKYIPATYFEFKSESGASYQFCALTDDELYALGADKNRDPNHNSYNRHYFTYSIYMLDEYFETKQFIRENKLKDLGI